MTPYDITKGRIVYRTILDPNVIYFQCPGVVLGMRKTHGTAGIHHTSCWRCRCVAAPSAR